MMIAEVINGVIRRRVLLAMHGAALPCGRAVSADDGEVMSYPPEVRIENR